MFIGKETLELSVEIVSGKMSVMVTAECNLIDRCKSTPPLVDFSVQGRPFSIKKKKKRFSGSR